MTRKRPPHQENREPHNLQNHLKKVQKRENLQANLQVNIVAVIAKAPQNRERVAT
jgi:hypothetical protein